MVAVIRHFPNGGLDIINKVFPTLSDRVTSDRQFTSINHHLKQKACDRLPPV